MRPLVKGVGESDHATIFGVVRNGRSFLGRSLEGEFAVIRQVVLAIIGIGNRKVRDLDLLDGLVLAVAQERHSDFGSLFPPPVLDAL